MESRDHRVEGNLRLGVVGSERVHTAPKDGVERDGDRRRGGGSSREDEEGTSGHVDATTPRGHHYVDREAKKVRYILHHHGDH